MPLLKTCMRCGTRIRSYSPMRKWCIECRRIVSLEQARIRKNGGVLKTGE